MPKETCIDKFLIVDNDNKRFGESKRGAKLFAGGRLPPFTL